MPYSEAQKKATLKWREKAIKRYEINLNRNTDQDCIDYLEGKNVQGEFKRLIRKEIENGK